MPDLSLLQRLNERKLVQWALAYLAGAWVVFEATGTALEAWNIPLLLVQSIHVLLIFGVFAALVIAWFHGERGQQRVSGPELLLLAAIFVVAGVAISMLRPGGEAPPSPADSIVEPLGIPDDRPSLAVLPLANLSMDEEDAYLAAGIHEEVIAQLSKISRLRVVSRTSVMGYREPEQNIRQIAAELGVGAVLEGSVQKVLNRVRVTVQLIDAVTDEHLWARSFDQEVTLENLLDIQAEVARQIAGALQTELTVEEQALVGARYTESLAAYQAYLRGRYFHNLPHYSEEDVVRASGEFRQAVALDSTFALAWMELANAHAQEVFYWTDASDERREMARVAAERAMNLDSPAPEVRLALGLYHLWLNRDAERALGEIARAEEGLPNNKAVYEARAAVYELLGRYDDAIAEYRKALNLSPGDASILTLMSWDYWTIRQYGAAEAYAQEAINLAPDQMWPNLMKVLAIWSDRGPTGETEQLLENLPHIQGWVIWSRFWQRMFEDRYEEALLVLSDPDFEWVRLKMWARPKPLLEAFAYRAMGRTEEATRSFDEARRLLEGEVEAHPYDPRFNSSLALALAGLGSKEDAVREGERAAAVLPTSKDAYYGLIFLWDLAVVHAMVGNAEDALEGIEHLLAVPSWVSPSWLEHDPRLDPLRSHPRFQALLER
jgi:TolB-like protein/Flp pilus assembly protein TadD